ncbi:MAG: hypothetical protein GC179_08715 [Anaerolineaceae bacterium]|nr:hypothetical protein [Anaerolineaceae bacterium]
MSAKKIVLKEPMEVYNLVARVNRDGLEATAEALECHPSTLSRWLDNQGFEMIRQWESRKVLGLKKAVQNAN